MSPYEILLILFVATLLVIAVIGSRRLRKKQEAEEGRATYREGTAQISHAVDPPAMASKRRVTMMTANVSEPIDAARLKDFNPPAGSIMYEQIEVGQTISVLTETATYVLTLRDAAQRRFEAVRVGLTSFDTVAEEAFEILFRGSHLPLHGYVHGWFVIGGRMTFLKARKGVVYGFSTSTQILNIKSDIASQQAF